MKKLILLVFVSIFLLIPNYQSDLNSIPNTGDEIQYWEIGYGIFSSGEYKREIINSSIDENSKFELGYRRGEPIYPLLIASVVRINNLFNEVSTENCSSIDCSVFDEEVASLVFLAHLFKLIIILMVYTTLKSQYSYPVSAGLTLTLLLMLPAEYKDLITVLLLTLGIHFYYKKKLLGLSFLSLLPLSNAVFLYILPAVFIVYFLLKKNNVKNSIITLLILLIPSMIWMGRNYSTVNQFSITGRASEILSIRAEYSTNSFNQIGAGYIYYTPARPFIFGAIQGKFWNYVTESGSDVVYNRSNSQSSYRMAKELTGVVGSKLKSKNYGSSSYVEQQQILNTVSINLIKENFPQHLLLSTVFGYRGMFPSINFNFIDFYSFPKSISLLIKEIFSFLRLFFIPYGLVKSIINLLSKKTSLCSLLLIILWGFFATLTHFIPRYATYLLIPAVLFVANIDKEEI
tara:strand:- start:1939 stop:3315 length:1377 start_codon:yes stop_codon:yes gene_type:complete